MIITLVMILMLSGLMIITTQGAVMRSNAAVERSDGLECMNAAETGLALHIQTANQSGTLPTATEVTTYNLPSFGTVVVTVDPLGSNGVDDNGDTVVDDDEEAGVYRVRAVATNTRGISRGVEIYRRQLFHPLFYKAIYVGNETGGSYTLNLGPGSGTPNGNGTSGTFNGNSAEDDYPGNSWQDWVLNGDFVDGDIHVNGDGGAGNSILITGKTDIYGDVASTGGIMGKPVSGTKTTFADGIAPPDLTAEDYRTLAQDATQGGGIWGKGDSGLPGWLFDNPVGSGSKSYDYNFYNAANYELDNLHFGGTSKNLGITSSMDGKVFVVKGNLWIDSNTVIDYLFPNTTNGVKMTIVVEGNLIVGDGVLYNDPDKDGILFIVKSTDDPTKSKESYDDDNMNGVYDPGETILNDDGDGVYEGPKEGQGNIWYGDKHLPKGGISEGYYYAQ
ncbi:MAG TPA: hypothetical protein DEA08_33045, partial [Planctomycetes bacterium]|nr:hypothetical protein [Planctomycetota bacterium]